MVIEANEHLRTDLVKIGFTTQRMGARMGGLQIGCPFPINYCYYTLGDYEDGARLHKEFAEDNIQGEWFICTKRIKDYMLSLNLVEDRITQKISTPKVIKSYKTIHYIKDGSNLCGRRLQKGVKQTVVKRLVTCSLCKRDLK